MASGPTTLQQIDGETMEMVTDLIFLRRSIHDYWKNYSFDYMDLCRQSKISAF